MKKAEPNREEILELEDNQQEPQWDKRGGGLTMCSQVPQPSGAAHKLEYHIVEVPPTGVRV